MVRVHCGVPQSDGTLVHDWGGGREEGDGRNCSSMGMFALTSSVQPQNSGGEAALAHTPNLRGDGNHVTQW